MKRKKKMMNSRGGSGKKKNNCIIFFEFLCFSEGETNMNSGDLNLFGIFEEFFGDFFCYSAFFFGKRKN